MSNEAELIARVAQGDKEALRAIYDLHAVKVYNMILNRFNDKLLAEDITQDVFLTVYEKSISFRGDAKVATWIYRIAFNKCLDAKRKSKMIDHKPSSLQNSSSQEVEPLDEQMVQLATILNAIDTLKENQKQAFTLVYLDKIPQQEVAEILNLNLKALESLLFRARQALQKILSKNEGY